MSNFTKMYGMLKRLVKGPDNIPTKAWIELTDECNSHCKTCSIWKKPQTHKNDLITPDDIYRLFSDPLMSKVDEITNSGGEMSLREDMLECLLAEHRALPNARIVISTNGTKPWEILGAVYKLLTVGANVAVGTSIEAVGKEHDSIRGVKNNFGNILILIDFLKQLQDEYGKDRLSIGFGTTLTKYSAPHIEEIKRFAKDNDLYYLIQWAANSSFYGNEDMSFDRSVEREIVSNLDDRFNILREMWLDYLDGKPIKFKCRALRNFVVVRCNGDVIPCLGKYDEVVGNIKRDSISHIWECIPSSMEWLVGNCKGCLNSWGTFWSFEHTVYPYLYYYIKHPIKLWRKLIG
jgi:MoaA/NifB/PqqE/SkfB family radical SAM enzyme